MVEVVEYFNFNNFVGIIIHIIDFIMEYSDLDIIINNFSFINLVDKDMKVNYFNNQAMVIEMFINFNSYTNQMDFIDQEGFINQEEYTNQEAYINLEAFINFMEDISKKMFNNFVDINLLNLVINIDYLIKDTEEILLNFNFKKDFNYYKVINN